MPFHHNDHYHDLLLRQLPAPCRTALDVGCGTGEFAEELALRGLDVDAVDANGDVIASARKRTAGLEFPGRIDFRQADITRAALPPDTYDYISCLASIHHVPFETVRKLRASLTANGVLVILGCYRESTFLDHAVSLSAVPVNAVWRTVVFLREKSSGSRAGHGALAHRRPPAPVAPPSMSLTEIRRRAATDLPRSRIRRLLFWRYVLVFRNAEGRV